MSNYLLPIFHDKMEETFQKLEEKLGFPKLSRPRIEFKKLGRAAGRCTSTWGPNKGLDQVLHINPDFLTNYGEDMLDNVLPHEVCHAVATQIFRVKRGMKIKSHGPEWGGLMRMIGLAPRPCHSYDLEGVDYRVQARVKSECCGRVYSMTQSKLTRRKKEGRFFICTACRRPLAWVQDTSLRDQKRMERAAARSNKIITPYSLNDENPGDEFMDLDF